jgi:hypothetical protein
MMTKDKKIKTKKDDYVRSFKLTRAEIEKLYEISKHFTDVNLFTIEQSPGGGIGVVSRVRFDLFDKNDTNIDVTDVKSW